MGTSVLVLTRFKDDYRTYELTCIDPKFAISCSAWESFVNDGY